MQYHLYTIPVWEAMEWNRECPLCGLHRRTEQEEVERALGPGLMEPDVRIQSNLRGFCATHHQQMFACQNRLGHALLMDTHTQDRLQVLEKCAQSLQKPTGKNLLRKEASPAASLAEALTALGEGCVICDSIETHMARYRHTFLHLWKTNADFQKAWDASHGVCLPHTADLLKTAQRSLSRKDQSAFAAQALSHLTEQLALDKKDLDWFTRKFDYRNENEPWGNSKTALERAVNRLRGWCLGDEPWPKNTRNHT